MPNTVMWLGASSVPIWNIVHVSQYECLYEDSVTSRSYCGLAIKGSKLREKKCAEKSRLRKRVKEESVTCIRYLVVSTI